MIGGLCGCCGPTTFCVAVCSTSSGLAGALVQVKSGSTVLGSCTTGPGGCCQIAGLSSGTYTVVVTYGGSTVFSGSKTITAGGTVNVFAATPATIQCCPGASASCGIPNTLHLTDVNTTIALTYNSGSGQWSGCYTLNTGGTSIITSLPSAANCQVATVGTGSIDIGYTAQCVGTGLRVTQYFPNAFFKQVTGNWELCGSYSTLSSSWSCGGCNGTPVPTFYWIGNGVENCTGGLSGGTFFYAANSVLANWSSCSPFAWSQNFSLGSFVTPVNNYVGPADGMVAISS